MKMLKNLDKKSILYLSVVVFAALLSLFLIWYFSKIPETKEGFQPPEKPSQEETMEEVLERLTPKDVKPLTEEEKKEQEKLLKELTPTKPKPMSGRKQKELEELLKKLTP